MRLRLVLLAGLGWMAGANFAKAADLGRHVVVISVDGLAGSMVDDPQASLPTIRALRAAGASAARGMIGSNPSVTWPNHTTLMTGVHPDRHGVLYNGVATRGGAGRATTVVAAHDQATLVRVPLLFDTLEAAGLTSSAINWPCTRNASGLVANFPDVPDQLAYTTESLKRKLGELPRFEDGNGIVRDEVWTEAACRTILDDKPNLLALHLLITDSTQHRYGPNSPAAYTAAALADANVGKVLAAVATAGLKDSTDVFIVSDHGFAAIPKEIRPNAILRREGLLEEAGGKVTAGRVQVISEGGTGMVYLTDPATRDPARATVRRLFDGAEGVAAILEPADYAKYHLPRPEDHAGMADLIMAAMDGYSIGASAAGDSLVVDGRAATGLVGGTHGFLTTEPKMAATFVAAGPRIKPGVKLDRVDNVDVAPTIARLLGVPLGPAGR